MQGDHGVFVAANNMACEKEDWRFEKGQQVTLFGFNDANDGPDMLMHSHWHPYVTFDAPVYNRGTDGHGVPCNASGSVEEANARVWAGGGAGDSARGEWAGKGGAGEAEEGRTRGSQAPLKPTLASPYASSHSSTQALAAAAEQDVPDPSVPRMLQMATMLAGCIALTSCTLLTGRASFKRFFPQRRPPHVAAKQQRRAELEHLTMEAGLALPLEEEVSSAKMPH